MLALFRQLVPDFDRCQKAAFVTHADVDHCGLLDLFPQVYMSRRSRDSLVLERQTGGGIREQNPSHAPYIQICKTLTSYLPPDSSRLPGCRRVPVRGARDAAVLYRGMEL